MLVLVLIVVFTSIGGSEEDMSSVMDTQTESMEAVGETMEERKVFEMEGYDFTFSYPASWPRVSEEMAGSIEPHPDGRYYIAIWEELPAQDLHARIDVYDADVFIGQEIEREEVQNSVVWNVRQYRTNSGSSTGSFEYWTEHKDKIYSISGEDYLVEEILSEFQFVSRESSE